MARGIVRAADRVAVWHSAALEDDDDSWEQQLMPQPEPVSPPVGAEQKPIPKSNKFTIPANGLKKTVENHTWHPDEAASKGQKPHTDIGLKNWFDAKPDFAKTYMKPHYQDALKSHLGDENYDKLKYHMPKEHHDALHTHQQAAPPKSNKFTTPANGLKKLLDQPHTETSHVSDWLAKHPGFQKTYMSPKYTDALKGHLGDKAYNELQEHLKAAQGGAENHQQAIQKAMDKYKQIQEQKPAGGLQPPADALKPGQEGMLNAWKKEHPEWTPPKKPTKKWVGEGPEPGKNLQQALTEATGYQWGEGWADHKDPMNKEGLGNHLVNPGGHWSPEQLAGIKKVYKNFYGHPPSIGGDDDLEPADLGHGDEAYTSGDAHPAGLGDKLAPHLPHLNVDSWNDVGATDPEGAKSSLDSLIKAVGHGDPETAEKLKAIHNEHFSDNDEINQIKQQQSLAPEDDPWHTEPKKSFGEQLNAVIPGMHPGNWDAYHQENPEGAAKALQKAMDTHGYDDDKKPVLQKIYDEHFGDQDEIDQIKGQQPQKSFGEALHETFPDLLSKEKALSYDEKSPEEQQKLLQNTVNGQVKNHPELWDGLNKLHNDFFGKDAYNPHPAKEELAQQMAENHGSNYDYDNWIEGLDNDDLQYYKEKPNAAKDAFDTYVDENNYDEDYDDPDSYDYEDDEQEDEDYDPEYDPESDDYDPYTSSENSDNSFSNFHNDWKKAFPDHTYLDDSVTPEKAKGELSDMVNESEQDALGDPRAYGEGEYDDAYDNWMQNKVKAQQLYDKYFDDDNDSQPTQGGHPDFSSAIADAFGITPGTGSDFFIKSWMDKSPEQLKKDVTELATTGKLNGALTSASVHDKWKKVYDQLYGGQQQGIGDKLHEALGGKMAPGAKEKWNDWEHSDPDKMKGILENMLQPHNWGNSEQAPVLQKIYDDHFGSGGQHDYNLMNIPQVMDLHGDTKQHVQNWLQGGNGKAWANTYLSPGKHKEWGDNDWADDFISHLPDEHKAQLGVQSLGQKMKAINPAINAEVFDKQSPEGQKDILQNIWAKDPDFGWEFKQLYDEHYGDADEVNNIKQTHDPVQLAKELAPLVNNQDYQTMHQSGKKWIDKTPEEAKADLQQLIGIYDDKAPQLQALYDKYFGGQQQNLTSDEFSQWANDFDNKAPANSWQNSADQWQNLANGIDEIFPKNKLPMSSMSVDDLKQKVEGWLEHLKDTPGHKDNLAKLQALYDQNFGDGDINAIKSQMPAQSEGSIGQALGKIYPNWGQEKVDWFDGLDSKEQKEYLESWVDTSNKTDKANMQGILDQHFGQQDDQQAPQMDDPGFVQWLKDDYHTTPGGLGSEAGSMYWNEYKENHPSGYPSKPYGDIPQSHVNHAQILDAFGEPSEDFMQWFAKDNGWKWGENPGQDKDLLTMLHDPENHWTQQKVNKYLKDQDKPSSEQYTSAEPLSVDDLTKGVDWGDQKPKSFGGMAHDIWSHLDPDKFDAYSPSQQQQYLKGWQAQKTLTPDQKTALDEIEKTHFGDEQNDWGDLHPLDKLQALAPGSEAGKIFNSPGFPAWYKQYYDEGGKKLSPLGLINKYKEYQKDNPEEQDEISQIKKHIPQGDKLVAPDDTVDGLYDPHGDGFLPGVQSWLASAYNETTQDDINNLSQEDWHVLSNAWQELSDSDKQQFVDQENGEGPGDKPDLKSLLQEEIFPPDSQSGAALKTWMEKSPEKVKQDIETLAGGMSPSGLPLTDKDLIAKWQKVHDAMYGGSEQGAPDLMGTIAKTFPNMAQGTKNKWLKMSPEDQKAMVAQHASGKGISGGKMTSATTAKWKGIYDALYGDQAQQGQSITSFDANEYAKEMSDIHGIPADDIKGENNKHLKDMSPEEAKSDLKLLMSQEPGFWDNGEEEKHQAIYDKYFAGGSSAMQQDGDGSGESAAPEWDPNSFAQQYKEVLPGSSSSLAGGSVDPQKAFTKLTDLISAHPDSDKTPKLQKMLDHWFPDGAPESQATVDPAQKKKITLPAGSAHYKALMKNVMNKPQGAYSENDLKTFRSKKFKDWFDAAPPGYQKTLATNPGIVIDDFDNGNYSAPVGGGEWGDSSTHKNQYYDVMGYPKTKKNDDLPEYLRQNPSRPGGEGIKFPRHEDEQETLPLSPGEHFAPHYAPMPIYRLFPIELDKEPKVPGWVKGEKNQKLFVEQQKARLRRIDEIINGTHKARNTSSDTSSFNQWTKSIGLSNQDKTDLYNSLFAPVNDQPTLFDDDRWKLFEDKAKELGIAPEKLADLAENLDVTPGTPPKGNYDHPDLAELILDYAQGYRGHTGRGGLGTHWTRDRHKVYEGVGGVQSASPSSSRNLTVGISGLWSGQGEGTGSHGAFDPMDDSEREHNLEAGAPVWIRRLQIKDPNAAWHDLVDHGPISTWTPGRDETASGKTVRDKPSLAEELTKAIGGTHDAEVFDKLKPGHKAEMLMGKIWKDNPTKRPQVEALYRDFFVGRPDLPTKPHKRSASLQCARQTPKEIEARIIELEMSM